MRCSLALVACTDRVHLSSAWVWFELLLCVLVRGHGCLVLLVLRDLLLVVCYSTIVPDNKTNRCIHGTTCAQMHVQADARLDVQIHAQMHVQMRAFPAGAKVLNLELIVTSCALGVIMSSRVNSTGCVLS